MDKVPPLEKWSPKELVGYYTNLFTPEQEFLSEHYPEIREALFRLGTNIDMKTCWEKLVSSKSFLPNQEKNTLWLVPQIYSIVTGVFIRPSEEVTPQFKKKEIKKIEDLVNKLIVAIHNSREALGASFFTLHTKLSQELIEKNADLSKQLGFDVAPISSWAFISGVLEEVEFNTDNASLEPLDWQSWSHEKRAAWLVKKMKHLDLTSLLRTYIDQLKDIPTTYASEYVTSPRATITKQLFELMLKTYDEYMPDCVTPMVNAILNLELGIEDITPYKPKEKNS